MMHRLFAVVPLGFAMFFSAVTCEAVRAFIHDGWDMRFMDFGAAWLMLVGAIVAWVGTIEILVYGPKSVWLDRL